MWYVIGGVIDEIFVVKKHMNLITCPDVYLSIPWFFAGSIMAVAWVQKRPRMNSHSFLKQISVHLCPRPFRFSLLQQVKICYDRHTQALMLGYFSHASDSIGEKRIYHFCRSLCRSSQSHATNLRVISFVSELLSTLPVLNLFSWSLSFGESQCVERNEALAVKEISSSSS